MAQQLPVMERVSSALRELDKQLEEAWDDGVITRQEREGIQAKINALRETARKAANAQILGSRISKSGSIDKSCMTELARLFADCQGYEVKPVRVNRKARRPAAVTMDRTPHFGTTAARQWDREKAPTPYRVMEAPAEYASAQR